MIRYILGNASIQHVVRLPLRVISSYKLTLSHASARIHTPLGPCRKRGPVLVYHPLSLYMRGWLDDVYFAIKSNSKP